LIKLMIYYFFWGLKENEGNYMPTLVPKIGDFHSG
jgi:hypothetical protein